MEKKTKNTKKVMECAFFYVCVCWGGDHKKASDTMGKEKRKIPY